MDWTCTLRGPAETRELGRRIGELVEDGATLALDGELGAGKTSLAQGIGLGLGVGGPVTSPTFQLLFVHDDGRLPLYHADLYRLGDESELTELGFDEILGQSGVSIVEWASRFPQVLPADRLQIQLAYEGEGRALTAKATGPRSQRLLDGLRA
ncbi:MAG: tRNA (adenosine(37)-N6)-threonylcarbamoyltransferase complex ATPase subunit type 1 TsaE [Proteobacteria bacterium]|nr:tRNA (adenosine(37)-N6)-threonylcarbamoyltransferase complex ATPase subunit type 1 TsaE [Pseudomonadota bacterium]MCP4915754.1 tRNA (adenosine(37)-N6)-threonylcarbamoyltransferase complex ATPase subunit type 1 TsaE [Pseudomonadota bacterium]